MWSPLGLNNSKKAFWIGLGPRYKPSLETVKSTVRRFTTRAQDLDHASSTLLDSLNPSIPTPQSDFQPFLLSSPLTSLLNERLLPLLSTRLKDPSLGWAGAETLTSPTWDRSVSGRVGADLLRAADSSDRLTRKKAGESNGDERWPDEKDNLALCAMRYLARRFKAANRYCLNCFDPVKIASLRPYVCDSELCLYAYQGLGLGPPVEYEICESAPVVDVLVSLCQCVPSPTPSPLASTERRF